MCRYVCGVGSLIPTRPVDGVIVWLAYPDVKHSVRDKFGALLQTAVEQIIGSGLRLTFEVCE